MYPRYHAFLSQTKFIQLKSLNANHLASVGVGKGARLQPISFKFAFSWPVKLFGKAGVAIMPSSAKQKFISIEIIQCKSFGSSWCGQRVLPPANNIIQIYIFLTSQTVWQSRCGKISCLPQPNKIHAIEITQCNSMQSSGCGQRGPAPANLIQICIFLTT